jgi:hypothetical protein
MPKKGVVGLLSMGDDLAQLPAEVAALVWRGGLAELQLSDWKLRT